MQYYVVKDDLDTLAGEIGTTIDELVKKVFPTRTSLRKLLLNGGPTRNEQDVQDISKLLKTADAHFALLKKEDFDFSPDAEEHRNDPLDYDASHFRRNTSYLKFERESIEAHRKNKKPFWMVQDPASSLGV